METGDNFAFMLPIMMGTFGTVFLLLSRLRLRLPAAFAWGVAFASGAVAFSVGLVPIGPNWQALLGDFLFFVSFYAYGKGLLVRFNRPKLTALRVGFIAACMVADAWVIFGLKSLEIELLLADMSLTLLLAVPVAMVLTRPRHIVDWALVAVAALVVVDTFVRVVIFDFFVGMSDVIADFTATQYAFYMQVSGSVLGLCFALAALGSVLLDIVERYQEAAEHDPLTGLYNRRGFEDTLQRRHLAAATGAVLVCDIDHFKQVNDAHGHRTGDEVIVGLARLFAASLPAGAIAARFGGEEFIAYLPQTPPAAAETLAEATRSAIARADWRSQGLLRPVTVSIGIAQQHPTDRTIHDTIARADRALYLAKAAGRNQVVSEEKVPRVRVGEVGLGVRAG